MNLGEPNNKFLKPFLLHCWNVLGPFLKINHSYFCHHPQIKAMFAVVWVTTFPTVVFLSTHKRLTGTTGEEYHRSKFLGQCHCSRRRCRRFVFLVGRRSTGFGQIPFAKLNSEEKPLKNGWLVKLRSGFHIGFQGNLFRGLLLVNFGEG